MPHWIQRLNQISSKWLWIMIMIGIISSLPFAYSRIQTEQSSKQVELVFNYSGLLDISNIKPNSKAYLNEQLTKLKQAGISSLAIGDSTLASLQSSKRLTLYSPQQLLSMNTTLTREELNLNRTYVLFSDSNTAQQLTPLIQTYFQLLNVKMEPWNHLDEVGLMVDLPIAEASLVSMEPDPITMKELQAQGFGILLLASNRVQPHTSEALLERWGRLVSTPGVHSVLIDGDSVPGYELEQDTTAIQSFAYILKDRNVPLALTEMQPTAPYGTDQLTNEMDGKLIRLHHLTAPESIKLADSMTKEQLDQRIQRYQDRLSLAVKDRNIRMILISAKPAISTITGKYTEPLDELLTVLSGPGGAVQRIQQSGYTLGTAHPFTDHNIKLANYLILLVALGAIALIASTIACFMPRIHMLAFVTGIIGAAGLAYLSPVITAKILALGVGICAPTLTMIMALRWIKGVIRRKIKTSPWFSYVLFFGSCLLTMIGSILIVALLHGMNYYLLLDQFVGVRVASVAPIALVAVYILFFHDGLTTEQQISKVFRMLTTPITVLWVLLVVLALAVLLYYVSRTGNSGYASPIELMFRSLLENTLGVRPRNKEILLAHPLFLLGAYLTIQKKSIGWYIIALGIIGQTSILGTFNHLHTPLPITILRVILGAVIGAGVGAIYIGIWTFVEMLWTRKIPASIKRILTSNRTHSG